MRKGRRQRLREKRREVRNAIVSKQMTGEDKFPMSSESQQSSDEDEYYESLPVDVKRAIQGLRGLQVAQVGIRKIFQKEVLALERKYSKDLNALYQRRKQVLLGKIGVSKEEIILGEVESLKEDEEYRTLPPLPEGATTAPRARVPMFWLRVLKGHPDIEKMIQEKDEPALQHLTDITVSYPTTPSPSFSIHFRFSPNEFFSNSVLSKTYVYKDEISFFGRLLYSHVTAGTVQWKSSKDLTKLPEETKKLKDNSPGREDEESDDEGDTMSFFSFFCPPPSITQPEESDDARREDERDVLLEEEFEIGEALKDHANKQQVLPRAIDYFTGDALWHELNENSDHRSDTDTDNSEEDEDADNKAEEAEEEEGEED
ncbi:NAP-domain-containing protein [Gloeophyllum trabeum ATCC 11539]|uniref:NAP-domain-containing protein n=1 Tax=Gloeophyllum trabeum (strain ATCC 11539 / FP-39264 / Madison 617) TaxID=670483 RepID=S7PXG8_GLOTA|nr:NAP-domain-containing protein [Gloeophyllum trabeum ATCC 11539]EPQ52311.1 NAP-domain-containing protein [Gloeophyllum trabeum ATCC 11539]